MDENLNNQNFNNQNYQGYNQQNYNMQSYQNYNPNYNNKNYNETDDNVVGVGMWILTTIGCFIPLVNLVILIILAVSGKNKTQSNWAKAQLIVGIIFAILYFVIVIVAVTAAKASYKGLY